MANHVIIFYVFKKNTNMITTLNINKISDPYNDLIIKFLKDMFANYGEIKLIIKPRMN